MHRWTAYTLWLAGSLLAAWTPSLCAQASVDLRAASRNVYVREAAELQLQVSDFQTCEPPTAPDVPGAVMRQLGDYSEMKGFSDINGRMTQSHTRTYTYELTPQRVGELVIPPIAVQVDGKVLMTRELHLTVRPSDADQLFAIDVTTGRSRIYVGQRVPLTMTIWVKPARYGGQFLPADYMLRLIRPVQFGPFPIPASVKSITRRARPGGDPADQYYVYEFVTNYVPDKPGPLAFDIEAGIEYPIGNGARNLRAQANVEPAEVLPVPMEGRPADFAGAVGLFAIDVTASPLSVRVGDPIDLTIELYGEGPVETLPPPLLSANPKLSDGFRLPGEQLAGEMHDARRRFKLTIRAKRDDVTEIPAIEYPYFDPDAERFIVARSKPIPLTVAPAAEVAPPQMATPLPHSGADASALQALDGLRDIETSETALLATHTPPTTTLVASVMFVPPAVFLLTWLGVAYVQSRTADPARRRRQAALRTARRRIASAFRAHRSPSASEGPPTAGLAAEVATALSGYLADRFNEPPARFAGSEAVDFLRSRGVRDDLVTSWAGLIERCQEASFAGGAQADGAALTRQALDCLAALERQRL